MTRDLNLGRRAPASGTTTSVLMFLHGYGADGADLLGLAEVLAPHLPDTLFLSPDAPEPCVGSPMGRQWFPIPWLDGSDEAQAEAGLLRATADLDACIDAVILREGVAEGRIALLGFSQGAMIALHVVLRRRHAMAGVVAISGRLLAPERLAAEAMSHPPVLLIHGDADEVVPFVHMGPAGTALAAAGVAVSGHVMRGTGHGIAPDGLSAALAFLMPLLGYSGVD